MKRNILRGLTINPPLANHGMTQVKAPEAAEAPPTAAATTVEATTVEATTVEATNRLDGFGSAVGF